MKGELFGALNLNMLESTQEERYKLLRLNIDSENGLRKIAKSIENPLIEYVERESLARRLLRVDPLPSASLVMYNFPVGSYYSQGKKFFVLGEGHMKIGVSIDNKPYYEDSVEITEDIESVRRFSDKLYYLYSCVASGETCLLFNMIRDYIGKTPAACYTYEKFTMNTLYEMVERVDPDRRGSQVINGMIVGEQEFEKIAKDVNFDIHTRPSASFVGTLYGISVYLRKGLKDTIYFLPSLNELGVIIENIQDTSLPVDRRAFNVECTRNGNEIKISICQTFGMIMDPTGIYAMKFNIEKEIKKETKNDFNRYTALTKVEKWRS